MKRELVEEEYRCESLAKVAKAEQENCLNWELHRELCHRDGRELPKPWRLLEPQDQANFRDTCHIDLLGKDQPISAVPAIFASWVEVDSKTGEKCYSAEVVTISLELLMRWDRTDTALLKGIENYFGTWIKEQRKTNSNARYYKGKPDRGRRKTALQWLARLAVWRLRKFRNLNDLKIEIELKELFDAMKIKGLAGNLSRWCTEIGEILRA